MSHIILHKYLDIHNTGKFKLFSLSLAIHYAHENQFWAFIH